MLSIVDLSVCIILPGGVRDLFDPQHMGKRELALGVLFLISLKVNLSFIPMFVHAYTTFLMAQPKVSPLNRNEGFKPPNRFSELPTLLSFNSPRKSHQCPSSGLFLFCTTKTQHLSCPPFF